MVAELHTGVEMAFAWPCNNQYFSCHFWIFLVCNFKQLLPYGSLGTIQEKRERVVKENIFLSFVNVFLQILIGTNFLFEKKIGTKFRVIFYLNEGFILFLITTYHIKIY